MGRAPLPVVDARGAALPLFGPPPSAPLCQHAGGSCAACCGLYNFQDRRPEAQHARLQRRTARVTACFDDQGRPDIAGLAAARDALLDEERPQYVTHAIKVCPFAGYTGEDRVGCLLHPTRMPGGEDLRDLAVYPREVCAGHFCAPHEWLRPVEVTLAQTATGPLYGRVVTDAGLVKAVRALLEEAMGRSLRPADVDAHRARLHIFWRLVLEAWPYADPDPRRFGGVWMGHDDTERTLAGVAALLPGRSRPFVTVLDAAGTASDPATVERAAQALDEALGELMIPLR